MVPGIDHPNGDQKKSTKSRKPHVLFVTVAFPGHFAPIVQLLYGLEAKHPGLAVTVWGNKDRIAELKKLQLKGDLQGLDLRLEEAFGAVPVYLPDPIFPVRAAPTSAACFQECEPFRTKLLAQKDSPEAPTAILADMFQYWSKDLADDLGIPWYTYFSTAPMFLMNIVELPKLVEAGIHPWTSPNLNDIVDPSFPGFPHVRIRDLIEEMFYFDKFYEDVLERTRSAAAVLLNTSEELDSLAGTVAATRALLPSTRVWPIGPSLQYPGFGKIYSSPHSSSNCLEWLDSQPAKSVLYVAFGSIGSAPKEYIMELAAGLEASGVPFLWALRAPPTMTLSKWLPEGFLERIEGLGIIETAWAPQTKILAHPSTGGFLSHSGWNSTLESLCAGVPLISWPLSAEQPMNARFIADISKVGLALCYAKAKDQDSHDNISRQVITKTVRQLMLEEKGEEVRRNAAEVKKGLLAAVAEGGSSYQNLNTLLDELTSVTSKAKVA